MDVRNKEKVMKKKFKGKCKNCPYGEKSKIENNILCSFGGIRELNNKCNILVLGKSLLKIEKRRKNEQ